MPTWSRAWSGCSDSSRLRDDSGGPAPQVAAPRTSYAADMSSEDYGDHNEYTVDDEDQLQPEDTLVGQLGEDVLDDGYTPPDREPRAAEYGLTAAEQRQGETLDQRLRQEEPEEDVTLDDDLDSGDPDAMPFDDEGTDIRESRASGRTAEEAAMHVVDEG